MIWVAANWKLLAGAALGLALLVGGWTIYLKGEHAGEAGVKASVQTETIRKLEDARISKEKTDEEVRRTPYGDRVDGLR